MGKKEGNGSIVFILVMITITGIWNFFVRNAFHGYLGFRIVCVYALCKVIHSIIHDIHYQKFLTLRNPFFLLLLFGGYYILNRLSIRLLSFRIIWGFDWFEWFTDSFWREIESPLKHYLALPFFLLSFTPYYIIYYNIKHRGDNIG